MAGKEGKRNFWEHVIPVKKDDFHAKYALWARGAPPVRIPKPEGLPPIKSVKFATYAEFNEWKRSYLLRLALRGGVQWSA